ncbi:L-lactate permease [Bacillus sp. DTU_2020_1000418_1_SI_GHA_SEK_038]|uniref:L-lactate permease n=1 Tax=Bacillus sp. DTU_2020_1000418_1_SI_GHA_SEK_038 TaxID=3077585 RepID=UPI0028E2C0F8|nr:L-lactate permease [Bacillus sp. DTU_2020_1000418_1_SI_GHA_SEK_038]WNS75016.1 L-lactate permease [Bacillus sp. DTU_2020_1000418_1_SI_GHA_SEK_038]
MELPVNILMWLMAAVPIIILILLMVKFNWGAAEAAPIGLLAAFIISIVFYKSDLQLLGLESAKGIWTSVMVIVIILPAILIYEVTSEAKAFDSIRDGLKKFTSNELLQIMAIGWVFASFLQGITGFGVPIAVCAPLLVGLGVRPLWAVVIALLGQAWGNTFGTLAVAWDALVSQTGIEGSTVIEAAIWASIFIWIINIATGITISWVYGRWAAVKKGLPAVIIISLIQGGGQTILSPMNPAISAFIPSLLSLVAILFIGKLKMYKESWNIQDSKLMLRQGGENKDAEMSSNKSLSMNQAFVPFYVLTGITLLVLLIPPLKAFLNQWQFGLSYPETMTGFGIANHASDLYSPVMPLTNSGLFLLLSAIIGYAYFKSKGRIEKGGGLRAIRRTIEKTIPSTIAVIALIIMSKIMGGTGQTTELAMGTAGVMGQTYVFLAPAIGLLGSFMTSSNMSSNILFGGFQQATSSLLKLNEAAILGAHTAGGAIGSVLAPSKIILGTTTAGILGQEGIVLKKILPISIVIALLIGIILTVSTLII